MGAYRLKVAPVAKVYFTVIVPPYATVAGEEVMTGCMPPFRRYGGAKYCTRYSPVVSADKCQI